MPRQARLDAPGTLHHVIVRGIEKRKIVDDTTDRKDFISRLGQISADTATAVYAWSLMTNHAHILLKSSSFGLSHFMRRLLTGYALSYNRRHRRYGHLFQNRYKSIICEEDSYFKELVRYIHLNPLRAKLVKSLAQLDRYRWCGHSVVMGRRKNDWQDIDYVLEWFGKTEGAARKSYRRFIQMGIDQGRRPELVGGGLIRSMGGWSQVKSIRLSGMRERSDERILGNGEFVDHLLKKVDKKIEYQFQGHDRLKKVEQFIAKMCKQEKMNIKELKSGSRRGSISKVRRKLAISIVGDYGISFAETARQLGVSTSAISKIISRAEE
ncbi:transposase [Thermodesulfobacteriota bacterium]